MATYAPGDPNTPSYLRTAANGWNGSRYIGTGTATPQPATAPQLAPTVQPVRTQAGSVSPTAGTVNVTAPGFNPSNPGAAVEAIGLQNAANNRAAATAPPPATPQQQQPPTATALWTSAQREQFKNQWLGTGTDVARQNQLLAQYGLTPSAAGRVALPTGKGEVLDLRYGAKAGINQAQWTRTGGGGRGNDPRLHDGIPGNAGTPIGPPILPPGQGDDYDEFIRTLIERSTQSLNVDPRTDANLRNQVDPFRAQVERQRRDYLADMAERSGPNANLRGEARLASERAGQAVGLRESELIGREMEARRQEIQDALNSRGAMLTEQQRQALTRELAKMNDATQRYGISTSASTARRGQDLGNDQFMSDLGLRATDRDNYWDAIHSGLIG